ncbi:MAG TPA: radical SAM protein [Cryomorphaceae bacterium]|nr:radical SAM protein [Cryomorphaceae bacterium]
MGVELRPMGVKCNIACQYCYQHPQRDVEDKRKPYDMERMKKAILKEGQKFTLFGGEALMVPLEDLEELWSWGLEEFGVNSVQTNGSLITEEHIDLFIKYKVQVGVSMDGPDALNDVRWAGSLERTREHTQKSQWAIERMCAKGIPPAMIITLHKGNATADKLTEMDRWLMDLDTIGVNSVRLHLMEVESETLRETYHLSPEENLHALTHFHRLEKQMKQLRFDIFGEIKQLQNAEDHQVSCVWKACDPYTTVSVSGVEGEGQRSNCGRTNKEGIEFVKAPLPSYSRYIALYHTPQEAGGCKGCRFFSMCKGHCPGTSLEGDWRFRTEHCQVWKKMFELAEEEALAEGKTPLSQHPARPYLEKRLVEGWSRGQNYALQSLIRELAQKPQMATV